MREKLARLRNNGYNPTAMYFSDTFSGAPHRKRPRLLGFCVALSLLLHIVVVLLLMTESVKTPVPLVEQQKPTIVRLVDQPRAWELDPPPATAKEQKPTAPARLAERDQRVAKEQAPKGKDTRDQAAQPATPPQKISPALSKASSSAEPSQATGRRETVKPRVKKGRDTIKKAVKPEGRFPRRAEQDPVVTQQPAPQQGELPSLTQLTQLTPATIARSQNRGRQEKIKERKEVEEGDTVWLNLERGDLISFFRRFRNQIEGVWNYPPEAARNQVEGVLLLKIIVDRQGDLLDVELQRTSGSDLLDYEAIEAVYRSAPFGPLPQQYPHPELKIFANFRYILSGKYIYGRQ